MESVQWLARRLLVRQALPSGAAWWWGEDPLRLTSVLLVLFAEECLLHCRACALNLTMDECHELLQELVQTHAISQNDLMDAVATVDVEGSVTRLVHSRSIGAVGLWYSSSSSSPHGSGAATRAMRAMHAAERHCEPRTVSPTLRTVSPTSSEEAGTSSFTSWYMRRVRWMLMGFAVCYPVLVVHIIVDDAAQMAAYFCFALALVVLIAVEWPLLGSLRQLVRNALPDILAREASMALIACYAICLMLYGCTLPPEVVAAQARARIAQHWLSLVASYFIVGCFISLHPVETRAQRLSKACAIMMLLLRGVQIGTSDPQPLDLLLLCLKVGGLPCAAGLLFVGLQRELVYELWLHISFAKREARHVHAMSAADRDRAWELEVVRRETLVAQQSARKAQRKAPRSCSGAPRVPPNADSRVDGVTQEDGYCSPLASSDSE